MQAPVLPKLSISEQQHMNEIEETYLFKEIIEFRSQALDQIRNKISQEKSAYMNNHNHEKLKKYINEYYSEMNQGSSIEEESCDENSEEKVNDLIEVKFSLNVYRVIGTINVLSAVSDKKVTFLDNNGCECSRCKKIEPRENKPKYLNQAKVLKQQVSAKIVTDPNKDQYKIRGPPRHSLLPSRKMRDIAIEYGSEMFTIGSICDKTHSNEPHEQNMLKEKTLIIIIIERILLTVSGTKRKILAEMNISDIISFDPLSLIIKEINLDPVEKIRNFKELLNYNG